MVRNEGEPLHYVDDPTERNIELLGPVGLAYGTAEVQNIVDAFDELEFSKPETVSRAAAYHDGARGRMAVAMAVRGTHAELQFDVNEWLGLLGTNVSRVGYEWSIGH